MEKPKRQVAVHPAFVVMLFVLICIAGAVPKVNAQGSPPDITFSGTTSVTGFYSNRPAAGSAMESEYMQYRFSGNLGLYGMPVRASLFLTTESQTGRANRQRFSISADPSQLLRPIPVLSWFSDISLGRTVPSYSRYTLEGTRVDGVSVVMNPGALHLAFVTGRAERSGIGSRPGFDRYVTGGQLGAGKSDRNHMFLTVIRVHDDPSSLAVDERPSGVRPMENVAAGLKGQLVAWERQLTLSGEIAGSVFTRDREASDVTGLFELPRTADQLLSPNTSTSFDYAWNLNGRADFGSTRLRAGTEWVGPGYRTLGNTWLRRDLFSWQARVDQFFWNRRFSANVQTRRNRDNLIPWKEGTTRSTSWGFGAGLRIPGYPSVSVQVAPHFQENDARGVDITTVLVSLTSSYTYQIAGLQSTTSLFASWQDNSAHNPLMEYTRYTMSVREVLRITRQLTASGSFSWSATEFSARRVTVTSGELGATYRSGGGYSISGGARISSQQGRGDRTGFYISGEVNLGWAGTLSVRAEQDYFRDEIQSDRDFDRSAVKGTLTRRF